MYRRALVVLAAITHLASMATSTVAAQAAGDGAAAAPPPRLLAWEDQRLVLRGPAPFARFTSIVALINERRFDESRAAIEALERPGQALDKARLALALAGHLESGDPAAPLRIARAALEQAAAADGGVAAQRLLHELCLFQILPNRGNPTSPWLWPARDMIRNGDVEAGRGRAAAAGRRGPKERLFTVWCLAPMFAGEPVYDTLVQDVDEALAAWAASGKQDHRIPEFQRLFAQARSAAWAGLAVPADSILYPKVLLEWMRAYYWWWKQMGERYRPMSKQGFHEVLAIMQAEFPDNELVRIYGGEQVPWGAGFRPDPVPDGAPAWAVNQRELRARVDHVLEWWFTHRQKGNGALGGGWEDDCEVLRRWSVTSFACGNERIEAGIRKLVDGIWNSGELVNGYDRRMKDVEHSSEMAADSSIMVGLDYGDPLQFERFLQTTKTTADVHTAVNAHGHLHFKSIAMSATATREDVDTNYHGRAMRPAAMIAWYARLPRAVDLLHGWAKAWSADTVRAGAGKPAGIIPAVVKFADDTLDGDGNWVARKYGDLYWWSVGRHDMVIGKMLGAWQVTGDDAVLDGLRAQLAVMRAARQAGDTDEAPEGSAAWAATHVARFPQFATWYRVCTGDRAFDDIVEADKGHGAFLISGDPARVAHAHAMDLNRMRVNLPMITSEVRGTDRVDVRPGSLLPALTGSSLSVTEPPAFAVTWRHVGPDFTALVRDFDGNGVSAWVYAFATGPTRPQMRFWRLEPGTYTLRLTPDADGDGRADGAPLSTASFTCRRRLDSVRFELPPRTLCLLEVAQQRRLPDLPEHMPDPAIMPRDLTLDGEARAGRPTRGRLVVHNIGSADANDIVIRITATAADGDGPIAVVAERRLERLACPADLVARTATVDFAWAPARAGPHRLEAAITCPDGAEEIYLGNNRASRRLDVHP